MVTFLTALSGISWSIVYIELIRKGFKDKVCGMPLFALVLNIAWELIYSIDTGLSGHFNVQEIANISWFILDAVILFIYFKFEKKNFPAKAQKYFMPFTILAVVSCFVMQFAFYFHFRGIPAAQYSAFAQNAAMSILFLTALYTRNTTKGQSMLMAVAKWIGTLAPAIQMGIIEDFNIYIVLMGVICSVFDIIYIIQLRKFKLEK